MAFNRNGLVEIMHMGTITGEAGDRTILWSYVTNDDQAAFETAGYVTGMSHKIRKGDVLLASLDNDATPMLRNYIVTAVNKTTDQITFAAQNVA